MIRRSSKNQVDVIIFFADYPAKDTVFLITAAHIPVTPRGEDNFHLIELGEK